MAHASQLPRFTSEIVKVLLVTSLTHVSDAVTSVQTPDLYLYDTTNCGR